MQLPRNVFDNIEIPHVRPNEISELLEWYLEVVGNFE